MISNRGMCGRCEESIRTAQGLRCKKHDKQCKLVGHHCDVRHDNSRKIILDLCGGTGAWSKPYVDAGYDVRLITLPDYDVLAYKPPPNVYGILAAPPCTDFTIACNRHWKKKDDDGRTFASLGVVAACLRIIADAKPYWWCLENPIGRLGTWIGPHDVVFQPWEFGDQYTKRTCLWGLFNQPVPTVDKKPKGLRSKSSETRWSSECAVTPPGFAMAFFEANP